MYVSLPQSQVSYLQLCHSSYSESLKVLLHLADFFFIGTSVCLQSFKRQKHLHNLILANSCESSVAKKKSL